MRKLDPKIKIEVERQVKMLLHAGRDYLRNLGKDTSTITFSVNDGYYGETFGIMRCLEILNYGYLGPVNIPDREVTDGIIIAERNLRWWFRCLEEKVLEEENWETTNQCDFCVEKYGKDGAGRTRVRG
jgi:hypothetical protein